MSHGDGGDRPGARRATYDAIIGLTAVRNDVALLTRDRRAAGLYQRLGVDVRWVDA
jgi:predicted nucleic acid-binding protein